MLLWIAALAGVAWMLATPGAASTASGVELTKAVAPFVALAVAIERFWEAVFSFYENLALASQRILGAGAQGVAWATTELDNAQAAVSTAAGSLGSTTPDPTAWSAFQDAERRLLDAQTRIAEAVKSPPYVALKRAVTLGGSVVIGIWISIKCGLHFLGAAGIKGVPGGMDTLLTGLIIAAGPAPMHSLIGVLQEMRNSVAGLADLGRGAGIRAAAQAVRETGAASAAPGRAVAEGIVQANAPEPLRTHREAARMLRPSVS
ncbi:MAG: hypothetical protein ACREBE_26050 [bacterium]